MDESEIKEKLKRKMEAATKLTKQEAEQKKRLKEIETDILIEIAGYTPLLLKNKEIIDEVPFDIVPSSAKYYLKLRYGEMYVSIEELASGRFTPGMTLTKFIEGADEEVLLKSKNRIIGFMNYIANLDD